MAEPPDKVTPEERQACLDKLRAEVEADGRKEVERRARGGVAPIRHDGKIVGYSVGVGWAQDEWSADPDVASRARLANETATRLAYTRVALAASYDRFIDLQARADELEGLMGEALKATHEKDALLAEAHALVRELSQRLDEAERELQAHVAKTSAINTANATQHDAEALLKEWITFKHDYPDRTFYNFAKGRPLGVSTSRVYVLIKKPHRP